MQTEKDKARIRKWKMNNPTRTRAHFKKWYEKNKKRVHNYYLKNREKQIARQRANNEKDKSNPERMEQKREYARKYQMSYMKSRVLKYKARLGLRLALSTGNLKMLPCEVCGAVKTEGHHPDYTKPLEIKWLCIKHHRFLHRKY